MAEALPFVDLKTPHQRIWPDLQARMARVMEHGQFILGPEVKELEERLSAIAGTRHCVAVANGTDALQIALMALDVRPGDEVITPSFSFIAAAEVIALLGALPVFCDVDPRSYNLDPRQLESLITAKTRAIIPVNLFGLCAEYDEINKIASRARVPIIEDAARSFGATYRGRPSGSLGLIATTSFFPSKPLGCYGDGGACFTNDDEIAKRMRSIRTHGQPRRYFHDRLGVNSRLDTLQAAVLLAKLEIFAEEVVRRQRVAQRYTEALRGLVLTPEIPTHQTSVFAQYTIALPKRDSLASTLSKAGIPTAIHYPLPIHQQPAFQGNPPRGALPNSEAAAQTVLSLPMHPYLSESDQDRVIQAVRSGL